MIQVIDTTTGEIIPPSPIRGRLRSRRRTWKREDLMSGRTPKRVNHMRRKAADELTFVVMAALMIGGYLLTH